MSEQNQEQPQEQQAMYRGHTITGSPNAYHISYDGVEVGAGITLEGCRATIDEIVRKRMAANARKMGRCENDPNALI